MDESVWTCERCGKKYDLEMGEGWVLLAGETPSPDDGKLGPLEPYEAVCYECADALQAVVEKCDHNCVDCEVPWTWGLSVKDCLLFQLKFGLLELRVPRPQGKVVFMGSLCDANAVLEQFKTYWQSLGLRWEDNGERMDPKSRDEPVGSQQEAMRWPRLGAYPIVHPENP
jgi:hypothetical protein